MALYKKGDVIGQKYEVHGVLGEGGFGVVYLVHCEATKSVYALKTFRDEYLEDAATRERFRREASVWVDLDRHPYLLRAWFVIEISHRLYIATEYIAPDEHGLNSLEGYLRRRPPNLAQSLCWAIELCHGMEYAYSKGIRSHRDIKPANILISRDRTVKITDFGLAGVLGARRIMSGIELHVRQGRVGLSGQTIEGAGFGTPTHMPPEQFTNAAGCDERSDIYAFGIVLYQMATGGKLPFMAPLPNGNAREETERYWWEMRGLHSESAVPRLDSPLFPIIHRCLEKQPGSRYQKFSEVRSDLEPLLMTMTGELVVPPELKELDVWEFHNKGFSLHTLERYEEALHCCDQILRTNPSDANAWIQKGESLERLNRDEEAMGCFEAAIHSVDDTLAIVPRNAAAWSIKGRGFEGMGRWEEAIFCYDQVLELEPRSEKAWARKGWNLALKGRHDDAIRCYDQVLALEPGNVRAWISKGIELNLEKRYGEAVPCFDQALALDPHDSGAWFKKGMNLSGLRRHEEAIRCYEQALALDPEQLGAWLGKSLDEEKLGRGRDALNSYRRAMALFPDEDRDKPHLEDLRQHLRELEEKWGC